MNAATTRRGRGKAKATMDLINACTEILAAIQPASVRAVCYRLFTMGLIESMSKGNVNRVGTQLVYARENGLIPWEWIVDETREAERISTWTNPDKIIEAAVRGYRRNYWQDQPYRVEVYSEKGTIRGTLAPVLNEFGVTLRVMHGFASATAVNDIADDSKDSDKPLIALYVGDFDPSGMYMSAVDLPGRLTRYGAEVKLIRIALVPDDLPGLPGFDADTKTGDKRHQWFVRKYGSSCYELDAMNPMALRDRVRDSILEYINLDAWQHAETVEKVEVASMEQFHAAWTNRISGQARI